MALPLTGGCLCGGVRFEVSAPPIEASYCHCTRCQRRTGTAASAQARIEPGTLTIVSGEELLHAYVPPGGFAKVFCSVCGSALFSHHPEEPSRHYTIRLGAFDGDPGVRPSYRQRVSSAAVWESIPDDGLTRYPEGRPADA